MGLIDYINVENRSYMLPFMGTNGLQLTGYTMFQVYNSPKKQLELAKRMDEEYPSDFIYPMDDGNIFCEILGVKLKKTADDFPVVVEHPIKTKEDLMRYKVPNPYKDGRMPINLKSLRLLADSFDKPVFVSLQGPFTLACQLAGADHFARCTIKNPEFVELLLSFTTKVVLTYAKAIEEAGVKYVSIAEPTSIIINPKKFDYLVGKNLNYIYNSLSCWKGLHVCGNTSRFLEHFLKLDLHSISFDQIMDLSEVIKLVPKEVVVIGNIDPLDVLARGTVEEVAKETINLVIKMRKYRNFLLAFGCTCLNNTPSNNLKAVTNIGRIHYDKLEHLI